LFGRIKGLIGTGEHDVAIPAPEPRPDQFTFRIAVLSSWLETEQRIKINGTVQVDGMHHGYELDGMERHEWHFITLWGRKNTLLYPIGSQRKLEERTFWEYGGTVLLSRSDYMTSSFKTRTTALVIAACLCMGSLCTQQPSGAIKVEHQIGFETAKEHEKGMLAIQNGSLQFTHNKETVNIPASSIEDVFTGADSQRAVGGTLGTLTMLAPYGGGRVVSMFRNKVDIIILHYRDANGGFHGCIFTLPLNSAAGFKKDLLSAGAHSSIPVEESDVSITKPSKDKKDKQ